MAGATVTVTDATFAAEVEQSKGLTVVDFWATWCGPCRILSPILEQLATERAGELKVAKVDVDENQRTAAQFGVLSIPTMILFKNGEAAKTIIGAYPNKKLEAELEPALA